MLPREGLKTAVLKAGLSESSYQGDRHHIRLKSFSVNLQSGRERLLLLHRDETLGWIFKNRKEAQLRTILVILFIAVTNLRDEETILACNSRRYSPP